MFNRNYIKRKTDLLANDILISGIDPQLDIHQVEVTAEGSGNTLTSGTIAFFSKSSSPNSEFQPVQKNGVPYVMDLSTGVRTFDIPNGSIVAIEGRITGALVVSGGTEWALNLISGRKG